MKQGNDEIVAAFRKRFKARSTIGAMLVLAMFGLAVPNAAHAKPKGKPGPTGPTGPQGPPGPTNFAVVDANGTLVRGSSSAIGASMLGPGAYEVDFNRDVSQCAYVATIGTPDAGSVNPPGEISVATRAGNSQGVFVLTTDSLGNQTDKPFHIEVTCPPG